MTQTIDRKHTLAYIDELAEREYNGYITAPSSWSAETAQGIMCDLFAKFIEEHTPSLIPVPVDPVLVRARMLYALANGHKPDETADGRFDNHMSFQVFLNSYKALHT